MEAEQVLLPIVVLLVLVAAGGLAAALGMLGRRADPLMRRLAPRRDEPAPPPAVAAAKDGPPGRLLSALGAAARGGPDDARRTRGRLVQAGLRGPAAPHMLAAAKVTLALALPLGFLFVNAHRTQPVPLAVPLAVWLCVAGFFAPNLWLGMRVRRRRALVERGLPDALDLLLTCVEAGLGLDAALQRVAADIALSWPLLSEELGLVFLELKAGVPRGEAFRRLHERTGVEELKTLAATLAQAEMFGTSIAASLRVQASGMRVRRTHRAEERAAIVSVKMTVPLVLCILPSLVAVVMGPAIVNIYQSMFRAGGR